MSISRLTHLGTKLNSLRSISTSLSSTRALGSSPFGSHAAGIRPYSRRHRFDDRERYERRTAVNWGVLVVPEQEAHVVERFGKFHKVLEYGIHLLIPLADRISYIHSLKEEVCEVSKQSAVTLDNVSLQIDGVLTSSSAHTVNIFDNNFGSNYAVDITRPGVRTTMELPAEAERKRLAQIVEAEGRRVLIFKIVCITKMVFSLSQTWFRQ
ncbi:Stomatin-like protein, partial [Drosera capensis]